MLIFQHNDLFFSAKNYISVMINTTEQASKRLGNRLRFLRKERFPNDDQKQFGVRIGVGRDTVRRMERGDPSVSLGAYMRAADMLDSLDSFENLFEQKDDLLGKGW